MDKKRTSFGVGFLVSIFILVSIYLKAGLEWLVLLVLFTYLSMIPYNYVIYLPLDLWRRFWRGRSEKGVAVFQVLFWGTISILIYFYRRAFLAWKVSIPVGVKVVGFVLGFLGVFLDAWAVSLFGFRRTVFIAAIFGTDEKGGLVTTGPYAIVRNPMYIGDTGIILGTFLLTGIISLLFLFFAYGLQAYPLILLEERELKERFGTEYERYSKRVPRLFPNFKKVT